MKRPLPEKDRKKAKSKEPKIQRLILPVLLQPKRRRLTFKKLRVESRKKTEAKYMQILAMHRPQDRIRRRSRLSSMRSSGGSEKEKGMAAVSTEKAKACILLQRMLDLVPSEGSRSPVSDKNISERSGKFAMF